MRILFFTSKPIYPGVDGGCFASQQFLNCLLHANIDVKYITLSTHKHPFEKSKFPSELHEKIDPMDHFVNTDIRPLAAFAALFSSSSYNADRFFNKEIAELLVQQIRSDHFDGIVFDSLYTLPYFDHIRSVFNVKIVVRTHNVEFKLWEQYAEESKGLKRWYLNRLAKDLKRFELSALSKVDAIFSISKDDSTIFQNLGISVPIIEVPVAVSVHPTPVDTVSNKLFFMGNMDWSPNIDAVLDLIRLMPTLKKVNPDLELHIAGAKSKEIITSNEQNGIYVHGFVDSVADFIRGHGILAAPIQFASGVRIKFLEAMALGIPIVTTPAGALGIDFNGQNCLVVAKTNDAFIEAVVELSMNPEKRKEIGTNAIHYIEKNHNIDAVSQKIVETFEANT